MPRLAGWQDYGTHTHRRLRARASARSIYLSVPCAGESEWNGLVTDGDCMQVDSQLHESLQVWYFLIRDESLLLPGQRDPA